ncbi:hypothetical protein [Sphingomonas adhaesiva]|nr:hypothetical protein [Sphingomonas adhaesiva]
MRTLRPAIMLTIATMVLPPPATAADRPSARSPDGRFVASTRPTRGTAGASGQAPASLWLTDTRTGQSRELYRGRYSNDPKRNLSSLANPDFSLDGGYVYVEADAYATSPAIHQVAVRTGAIRYVTDGALYGVLRSGPWRGFLVVQQHRYRQNGNGSFDPFVIVKPDGREVAMVPGSDGDDPERALAQWLGAKRWTVS